MRIPRLGPRTVDSRYVVALTAAVGFAITLLITAVDWTPAYQNRSLHVAKETVAALVLLLLAAVLAGRVNRRGTLVDLLALAGVLVLATKNLVFSVITAIVSETSGSLATWRTTGAGMVAAALLAAASLVPRRVVRNRRTAVIVATGCALGAFVLLTAASALFELPGALTDRPDTRTELESINEHPGLVASDVTACILFLIAGAAFARRAEHEADEFQLWLGIGTTIGGVAYLNYALFPSSYTDFVYAGDIFRIAAVAAFGVGTYREISRYQAVYAPAVVLEGRRQVARDLHEGVAQELALIASRMHELKREATGHERTVGEIDHAVHRALEESRAAISTLNRPLEEPLHLALATTAEDTAGRLGVQVELDLDEHIVVPPGWEHALPRMVREAITNAAEHGHALTVRIYLRDADGIWLRIVDDGIGFDPSQRPSESSFGLLGIRERTEALGGRVKVDSAPGRGTSLEILLP